MEQQEGNRDYLLHNKQSNAMKYLTDRQNENKENNKLDFGSLLDECFIQQSN